MKKAIIVSIVSFIIGVFGWLYIDLLNLYINGDEWTKLKKSAARLLYK